MSSDMSSDFVSSGTWVKVEQKARCLQRCCGSGIERVGRRMRVPPARAPVLDKEG